MCAKRQAHAAARAAFYAGKAAAGGVNRRESPEVSQERLCVDRSRADAAALTAMCALAADDLRCARAANAVQLREARRARDAARHARQQASACRPRQRTFRWRLRVGETECTWLEVDGACSIMTRTRAGRLNYQKSKSGA